MNSQETVTQLKELKLRGMASSFEAILSTPVQNRPSLEIAVAKLADAENQDRRDRKTAMYLKMEQTQIYGPDRGCHLWHGPELHQ